MDKNEYKDVIIDLTGGMDSRIVYGCALQNKNSKNKVYINSYAVSGSNDLDIAVQINSIYGLKWDTTNVERFALDEKYSDAMQRSFYMGIYYSHNIININNKVNDYTTKMIGACGEILLRPYIVRKYFNTHLNDVKSATEFLDFIFRDYSSEIIADYKAAKNFVNLHLKEFKNYINCSYFEIIDRIYLEHRHGYHFDQGIISKHGILSIMPLQSKKLFELHHKVYNKHKSIKLQLDVTSLLDPYLASIRYDDPKDNKDRNYLKDVLYYDKEYYRNIEINELNDEDNEMKKYNEAIDEKHKNTKYIKNSMCLSSNIDFNHKILCDLRYICKNDKINCDNVGIALYYYIKNNINKDSSKKRLRFLYNKINSLKDQMIIFKK